MTVASLAETIGLTALALPEPDREINGCYCGDLLSWVMGRAKADNAWITIMSNVNIVAVASLADVACVLLAENVTVGDDVVKTAEEKGVNILSSPLGIYDLAVRLSETI